MEEILIEICITVWIKGSGGKGKGCKLVKRFGMMSNLVIVKAKDVIKWAG